MEGINTSTVLPTLADGMPPDITKPEYIYNYDKVVRNLPEPWVHILNFSPTGGGGKIRIFFRESRKDKEF